MVETKDGKIYFNNYLFLKEKPWYDPIGYLWGIMVLNK